ncbi:MAG: flagellar motor switch protein FliN [Limnobacter sp.]|nr:flagellar motor switch protein FliN [Limnobacter sp.]
MADPKNEVVEDAADDWAAALAEQASSADSDTPSDASTDALFAQAGDSKPASELFQPFGNSAPGSAKNDIDMVMDIPVQLTVELGRTKIPIKHILQLAQGSVIELDGLAGEPMDVLVNGFLIAQGEVVVVNDKFGIRLTDIITPSERLRKLNR